MNSSSTTTAAPIATFHAWLSAVRPATLAAGAVPVVVGTALAHADGRAALWPALAALVVALLLQIGSNLVNDVGDAARGVDGADRLGPPRAAAMGWLSPAQLRAGAAAAFAGAALAGGWLASIAGWPLLVVGAAGIAAAIGYTAGERPLGYRGLGDVLVFLFFGLVAVSGTYFVQTGTVTWPVAAAAAAIGALATAILVVNNLRDRIGDARAGKLTLAVRLGARGARLQYTALIAAAFLCVAAVALTGRPAWGLPWLALPLAVGLSRAVWRTDGAALTPLLGATARFELVFGVLLTVGALL